MSSTTPASAAQSVPESIPMTGTWFHRVGLTPYTYLGLDTMQATTPQPSGDDRREGASAA